MTALAHIQERKGARIYDSLLLAGPVILLMAQFGSTAIELIRWLYLIGVGALSAHLIRDQKLGRNPVAIGIGLLAIYTMTTSFLSYYPSVSFLKSISLLLLAGFLLVVPPALQLLHPHVAAREYVIRIYVLLAVVVVLSNSVYYILVPTSTTAANLHSSASFLGYRFRGWFINPNGLAAIYGIFLVPILWFEISKPHKGLARLGLLLTFLLAVVQLLAAQSRAGTSAGIVSLLVVILGNKKWPSRTVILVMITLATLVIFAANPEDNLVLRLILRNEVDFTGSGRFPVWVATWNRFLDRPLLGSGLGVANTEVDVGGLAFSTGKYSIEKGSSYLGALEELGLVGIAIMTVTLLAPILKTCWRGWNAVDQPTQKPNLVLIAIVAASLVNATFEAWLLSVGSFEGFSFWLFGSLLLYRGGEP